MGSAGSFNYSSMQQFIYGSDDQDDIDVSITSQQPSAVPEYLFWYSLRGWHFTFIEVQLLENPELLQPEIEVVLFSPERQALFQKSIQYFADYYGGEFFNIDRNLEGRRIIIHVPEYRRGQLGEVLSEAQVKMLETEMQAGLRHWIFTIFALREGIAVEWEKHHRSWLFEFIYNWIYFTHIISTKELKGINPFSLVSEEQLKKTDENQPLNLSLYEISDSPVRILKWDKKETATHEYFYVNHSSQVETIYLIINHIHKNTFNRAGLDELKLHTKEYFRHTT